MRTICHRAPTHPTVSQAFSSVSEYPTRDELRRQHETTEAAMILVYSLVIVSVLFLFAAGVDWAFPEP